MLWSLCAASCCMCYHAASSRSAILVFWPIAKGSARSGCVPPFCPPRNPPHALRSLRHLAPYDCALTAREHSCSSHGSAPPAIGSSPHSRTGHLMTGRALAISIPTAHRRRATPPGVCLRSPLTDTNLLSRFRHRPVLSPNPSQTISIPAVRPRPKPSNPHSKRSSISDTAPFK